MKKIKDLLWEAEESLKNMSIPSYSKKAWYHNFCLCMDKIFDRSLELRTDEEISRYNNLCKRWK